MGNCVLEIYGAAAQTGGGKSDHEPGKRKHTPPQYMLHPERNSQALGIE